jgi:hypothetical protein
MHAHNRESFILTHEQGHVEYDFGGKTIGMFAGVALLINNITGPGVPGIPNMSVTLQPPNPQPQSPTPVITLIHSTTTTTNNNNNNITTNNNNARHHTHPLIHSLAHPPMTRLARSPIHPFTQLIRTLLCPHTGPLANMLAHRRTRLCCPTHSPSTSALTRMLACLLARHAAQQAHSLVCWSQQVCRGGVGGANVLLHADLGNVDRVRIHVCRGDETHSWQ